MKKFVVFLFLAFAFLSSCSGDDHPGNTTDPQQNYFLKFKYDGVQYLNGEFYPVWNPLSGFESDHHVMTIQVNAEDGETTCYIKFNKYGDFVSAESWGHDIQWNTVYRHNYALAAGEHFHFEVEALDEATQTVKGNFSGKLYKDRYDLNSEFVEVEGSFYNQYYFSHEDFGFEGVAAKINGTEWHSIEYMDPNAPLTNDVYNYSDTVAPGIYVQQFIGDDYYRILIGHETQSGVRDFTGSSGGTFARLSKYDSQSGTFVDFETVSGTIVITDYSPLAPNIATYRGVFNFTAIDPSNPSQTLQITDGKFYFRGHS